MPAQNELCGILIEDFLSIWKLRAVFLSGMLAILFEGGEIPWCAGIDGGGFLSIWNIAPPNSDCISCCFRILIGSRRGLALQVLSTPPENWPTLA